MNIFQQLTEKPWLTQALLNDDAQGLTQAQLPLTVQKLSQLQWPAKTALSFFLAVVTVIFFLFTITFLSRTQSVDFQALAGEPWLPFSNTKRLWLNTGILLLASLCLQLAVHCALKKQLDLLIASLTFACLFTIGFLTGQFTVWQQLSIAGYGVTANPANSYFYLLTGVHGLHLLGGIVALIQVVWLFWQDIAFTSFAVSLMLCARYWHYLLLIWLFLFTLLTATTDTYRTIALLCGF